MSRVHIYGATRASIIKERTRDWVATSNGTQHLCLRHCTDANVLWILWERVDAEGRTRYISCDVLLPEASGWGYTSMLEQDEPEHFSCPPSYLRESPPMSQVWRDQVRLYWTQYRSDRTELSKRARDRALTQGFKEGDRIRYVGPNTLGPRQCATGTIVRGNGLYGESIHSDELCSSVFVEWDHSVLGTIFVSQIRHELANSPSLDETSSVK